MKIMQLSKETDVATRVREELSPGRWAAKSTDEAVERVLQFDRSWAAFEFPRLIMALSSIQKDVLSRIGLRSGDYSRYAALAESLFLPPVVAALDEYGIPIPLGQKLLPYLGTTEDIDIALASLKKFDFGDVALSDFETELVVESQRGL